MSQAGRVSCKLKGNNYEKLCISSPIVLRSTCGNGGFCRFLASSGRTTGCKDGIIYLRRELNVSQDTFIFSQITFSDKCTIRLFFICLFE